jgi:cytochrome c oxidase assembly protein subunit 15
MCTSLPICQGDWVSHLDFKHAFELIQPEKESYEFGTLDYGARMTIHVTHRIWAVVVTFFTVALAIQLIRNGSNVVRRNGQIILALLTLQIALGVGNVVLSLPLAIAVAHNLGAAMLLLSVLRANYLIWQLSNVYSTRPVEQQGEYS